MSSPRYLVLSPVTYEEAIAQLGQSQRLIPKRIFFIAVPDRLVPKTVKTIIEVNRTGKSGDGKIFVSPVEEVYTISSGIKESGSGEMEEVKI